MLSALLATVSCGALLALGLYFTFPAHTSLQHLELYSISPVLVQCENIHGFEKCIDKTKAASASDSHLGPGQPLSFNKVSEEAKSVQKVDRFHHLPLLPTKEQALGWTPTSATQTHSPSQWLATALFDDWVHTNVLQDISVQHGSITDTGWPALAKVDDESPCHALRKP